MIRLAKGCLALPRRSLPAPKVKGFNELEGCPSGSSVGTSFPNAPGCVLATMLGHCTSTVLSVSGVARDGIVT